jgi:hypothetical protein
MIESRAGMRWEVRPRQDRTSMSYL